MTANVSLEKKDNLNALLTINLTQDDYKPKIEHQLKEYRKKANIPGFRKGMAPMGIVKKMVGRSIFIDEVNKLASESLFGYLKANNIDILGEPLPSLEKTTQADFDNEGDFVFYFDLGLAPDFELNFSSKDQLIRYDIEASEEDLNEEIENVARRYGKLSTIATAQDDKDSVTGLLTELDENGQPFEGGVAGKSITVLLEMIKDEETKNNLMGKEVSALVNVDIFKLYNNNEAVISSSTGVPKEGVNDLNRLFQFEITEMKRFTPSELNQELFDKVFGEGVVDNLDTFKEKIKENMGMYFQSEAEHHLDHMIQHLIIDNHGFMLPDSFLKRWLLNTYKDQYNQDNIDDKYEKEANGLKMQLITEKIVRTYNLEISRQELDNTSMGYTAQMLRQYGINNPDPELIASFETKNREDNAYMTRIRDMVINGKVNEQVKQLVAIEVKKIKSKDFYDLIKTHNEKHNH